MERLTRRSLARALAAAAAAPLTLTGQTTPPSNPDLESAHAQMRASLDQIAKVKFPMDTEPAFQFKA